MTYHPSAEVRRQEAIAYGAHHGFRELDPTTTEPPRPTVTVVSRSLPSPRRPLSSPRPARGGCRSLAQIAQDESGGNYTAQNPHSSASGKYQVLDSTWAGYGGYARAKDAPPAVQEAQAAALHAAEGNAPWSASGC